MSPTGETPNAPLAAETTLQPPSETPAAPVQEDVSKSSPEIPATTAKPSLAGGESAAKHIGLVVHHLNNSRSQRLLWLLEELEVPYEIKKYQRNAEMRAPQELKDVHPLGKSPILTDGELILAESGAITEYVITKYGERFRPAESGKIDDLYYTHYAEGSLMPILVNKMIFSIIPQKSPALIRPLLKPIFATLDKRMLEPEIKAHCAMIESHLKKSKTGWLAGGDYPTSADFMMVYPVEALVMRGPNFVGPRMKEYVERIHERPAYKRGLEKGGKHDYPKF